MLGWRAESVPPMATEPFAPPAQDLMPWLNYGFGVTWQDVGDIVRDRVLPILRTSAELRSWSDGTLEGVSAEAQVRSLVDAIVEGFTQMQTDLETEKRAMARIWKQREKQIEKVLLNTSNMYGAIKGIAGNAIPAVKRLELPGAEDDYEATEDRLDDADD